MRDDLRVGLVQMTSSIDVEENIETASTHIRDAAGQGADLIVTPEMTSLFDQRGRRLRGAVRPEADDIGVRAFAGLADALGIHLLIGSMPIALEAGKIANRSFLFGPDGAVRARYDKIHMFDVTLEDGESYRESRLYQPGNTAVVAETAWGGIGMSICYDLRFAYLYRRLARTGARILTVPAAFTRPTGRAHWHVLLRARAIETGCFILAPAQTGDHADGRKTFGHSLVVDPWGEVVADGGVRPGVIISDLDLVRVEEVRRSIPALEHGREMDFRDQTM